MKKSLLLCALAALTLGSASAATMSTNCNPPFSGAGQNGSGSQSCVGFTALPVGATLNSVTFNWVLDFQFDAFNPGTKEVTFTVINPPGSSFDLNNILVTEAGRARCSFVGSGCVQIDAPITVFGATADAMFAALSGPFNVAVQWTGASTAITGVTTNFNFTADYTEAQVIPEPGTYALIGMGLLGVAVLRRRK